MKQMSLQAWWRSLSSALVLMTTLPVKYPENINPAEQRRSLYCYPVVGFLIGLLVWGVAVVLGDSTFLSAALLLLVWVLLTGAIHLDGLADCADAWMAGLGDREKTLRILKDPLCGAVAVVTLVLILLVKVAAIQVLLESGNLIAFIVIPLVARSTPQVLFWRLNYVREGGLGSPLQSNQEDRMLFLGGMICSVVIVLLLSWSDGLWLMLVTALMVSVIAKASYRRLGGFTGDVAGAQIELVECALCVVAALLA